MGNTLEQYRAAIGCFGRCGAGKSSLSNTPDFENGNDMYDDGVSLGNLNLNWVVKGPWKLHAITIICLYILLAAPLMSSMLLSRNPAEHQTETVSGNLGWAMVGLTQLSLPPQMMLSTMLPPSRIKIELLISGIESNPGPSAEESRDEIIAKQNKIIAELCVNAPTNEVRDCLRLYDAAKEYEIHRNKFLTKRKATLAATLTYLGAPPPDKYTVKQCIHELICTIGTYLPDICRMCDSEFTIKLGETPLMACEKCGQGIHTECLLKHLQLPTDDSSVSPTVAEIQKMINPTNLPGLRYLCGPCDEEQIPSEPATQSVDTGTTNKNKKDDKVEDNDDKEDDSEDDDDEAWPDDSLILSHIDVSTSPSIPPPKQSIIKEKSSKCKCHTVHWQQSHTVLSSGANSSAQINPPDRTEDRPICKFYKQNRCRHTNSKDCNYSHPRPCKKLMMHGINDKRGCTLGKDCSSFHPIMCRESISRGTCFREDCTKLHMRGTKRTPNLACKKSVMEGICLDEKCKLTHVEGTVRTVGQNANTTASIPSLKPNTFLEELNILKMEMLREMDRMITSRLGTPTVGLLNQNHSYADMTHQCQIVKPEIYQTVCRQPSQNPGSQHFLQTLQAH